VPGEDLDHVAGDVEHGRIRDQREASSSADDFVEENRPTRGFTSAKNNWEMAAPAHFVNFIRFSVSMLAEKISV